MVIALDSVQPVFTLPPLDDIPDGPEDTPRDGRALEEIGPIGVSSLVFGAAAWSHFYNSESTLESDVPLRTIRLAMRYGIRSFDTSPYYGVSEIVLGTALKALEPEFPRSAYKIATKCGRYGSDHFDYSPQTIRRSIERSLSRLHTTYLDIVYLHDTEFVAPFVSPRKEGDHSRALDDEAAAYGLQAGEEAKIWGPGDQTILDAVAELRKMQAEGLIKHIGISGLPLPTLLRLSLLVLHTAPFCPLDAIMSYSQLNLQNKTLLAFLPAFVRRARCAQVFSASPLSMGLLTPKIPAWHPAPTPLRAAVQEAVRRCAGWEGGLPPVAIGWAVQAAEGAPERPMPTVVGLSTLSEVHQAVKTWRNAKEGVGAAERDALAKSAMQAFVQAGFMDWAWASGPQ